MSNGIKVKKRDGSQESINLDKIHTMVECACEGLAGVSPSQVEIQSGIQFYDGITTAEIQEILVRSASDLIDLENPNYQFVAAQCPTHRGGDNGGCTVNKDQGEYRHRKRACHEPGGHAGIRPQTSRSSSAHACRQRGKRDIRGMVWSGKDQTTQRPPDPK